MRKAVDLILGFVAGVLVTLLGSGAFVFLRLKVNPFTQFNVLIDSGFLGRILVIGSVLNLVLFWIFIKKNQDIKAGGTILAVVILTLVTQLI